MTTVLPVDPPLRLHGNGEPAHLLPGRLQVEPWLDPVVDEVGHDPRSSYVETFWLPVLGPSTTWLLRRFASHLDDAPAGTELEIDDLARRLGIGERFGPNSPFARTLKRCVDFQMAEWRGSSLAVRRRMPPLARRHLLRLPETLQQEHRTIAESRSSPPLSERLRVHGRRLALSLLDYGDDQAAAETQLVRWGFHPAMAAECATFAGLEHARRVAARLAHPAGPPLPAPRLRPPVLHAPPSRQPPPLSRLEAGSSPPSPTQAT